jgi:hypothetical protein
MGSRTAEQAKQDYVRAMGEPLGNLYHALWQEVAWLYVVWQEYVELYGSKSSRIDLLNEARRSFSGSLRTRCGRARSYILQD